VATRTQPDQVLGPLAGSNLPALVLFTGLALALNRIARN